MHHVYHLLIPWLDLIFMLSIWYIHHEVGDSCPIDILILPFDILLIAIHQLLTLWPTPSLVWSWKFMPNWHSYPPLLTYFWYSLPADVSSSDPSLFLLVYGSVKLLEDFSVLFVCFDVCITERLATVFQTQLQFTVNKEVPSLDNWAMIDRLYIEFSGFAPNWGKFSAHPLV